MAVTIETPAVPLLELKRRSTSEAFARLLRERGEVFFSESDRLWVVTSHALAGAVLKGEDFSADRSAYFAARASACPFHKVANFFGVVRRMMVTSDGAEHAARRRLAAFGVADEVLDGFRPAVERAVARLLEPLAGRRTADFARELALPLPSTVLADLFGVPAGRREEFRRWSDAMTQFFGGGSGDVLREVEGADSGAASLREYFLELIPERRRRPQDDFLSRVLRRQAELGLDDEEVVSQSAMMLVAGTVTTTDQMANNLNALLEGPLERLRAEPSLLEPALEEAARLDPAVNFLFRAAKRDTTLGSARLRAGELAFVSAHAANRDPRVFERPDAFVLDRPRNPHLSFGTGAHYCLGARLGRIQMSALFGGLLRVCPRLAPAAPFVRKHQSLGFSGFESMPLEVA